MILEDRSFAKHSIVWSEYSTANCFVHLLVGPCPLLFVTGHSLKGSVASFLLLFLIAEIQEFYEATLLDQNLSTTDKTQATLRVAERYANDQPLENGRPSHRVHEVCTPVVTVTSHCWTVKASHLFVSPQQSPTSCVLWSLVLSWCQIFHSWTLLYQLMTEFKLFLVSASCTSEAIFNIWNSIAVHITYVPHTYHIRTTYVPHAYRLRTTCIPHTYHMHTTLVHNWDFDGKQHWCSPKSWIVLYG